MDDDLNAVGAMTIKKMIDTSRGWSAEQLTYELGRDNLVGASLVVDHGRLDDPPDVTGLLNMGWPIYRFLVDGEEHYAFATTDWLEFQKDEGFEGWIDDYFRANA